MNLSLSIFSRPVVFLLAAAFCYSCTACDLLGIGSNDNDRDPVLPDTTSSQFTWRVDTVGFINTFLRDVAIIDSNNIWVVGEIPERDFSAGEMFNLLRWDGEDWNREQIPFNWPTDDRTIYPDIDQIIAFKNDDILIRAGGILVRWDGATYSTDRRLRNIIQENLNGMSGVIQDNMYFFGDGGSLFEYQGIGYRRVGTGTNENLLFAAFANDTLKFGGEHTLLQYVNGQVIPEFNPDTLPQFQLQGRYRDVWYSGTHWWYGTSSGLYRFSPDSGYVDMGTIGTNLIGGTGDNDVVAVSSVGEVYHWNGVRLTRQNTPFGNSDLPRPRGIAVYNNKIMVVGWLADIGKGFILTGERQN
ncbi:MAG: hypothetical protein AAFW89_01050 [Bacteroidota bacterium]